MPLHIVCINMTTRHLAWNSLPCSVFELQPCATSSCIVHAGHSVPPEYAVSLRLIWTRKKATRGLGTSFEKPRWGGLHARTRSVGLVMAELIGDVYRGDSWNFPVRLLATARARSLLPALQVE